MQNTDKKSNSTAELSQSDQKAALRIFWGQLRRSDREEADNDELKFLKKIPFFESLKKHQLEQVAQIVFERDYRDNEYIFEIDQPGAALFIVQSGEVSVEIPNATGEPTQLAVLGKHSFLGELALLDEAPRSASARTLVPTKVYALFRKDLAQLAETHPDITTQIYQALAAIIGHRLKAANEMIQKRLKAVA